MEAKLAWVKVLRQGGVPHVLPLQQVGESPLSGRRTAFKLWNLVVQRVLLQDSGIAPILASHWHRKHPVKKRKGKERCSRV